MSPRSYKHSVEDVAEAIRWQLRALRRDAVLFLLPLFSGIVVICASLVYLAIMYSAWWWSLAAPCLGIALFVIWSILRGVQAVHVVKEWMEADGGREHDIQADASTLVLSDADLRSAYQWSALADFEELKRVFVFRLRPNAPAAFFVPKRAFTSDAELDEFRRLLQSRIQPG